MVAAIAVIMIIIVNIMVWHGYISDLFHSSNKGNVAFNTGVLKVFTNLVFQILKILI